MASRPPRIDLHMDDLERLAERARQAPLSDDDYATLKAALHTLGYVAQLVEDKAVTIARLRQILFGASTEKTRDVLARAGVPAAPPTDEAPAAADAEPAAGHGRQAHLEHFGGPGFLRPLKLLMFSRTPRRLRVRCSVTCIA
jgi:hypothetical protein